MLEVQKVYLTLLKNCILKARMYLESNQHERALAEIELVHSLPGLLLDYAGGKQEHVWTLVQRRREYERTLRSLGVDESEIDSYQSLWKKLADALDVDVDTGEDHVYDFK